jgi:hypothetical protein
MDGQAHAVECGFMLEVAYAKSAFSAVHQCAWRGVVGCVDVGVADEVNCKRM